MTRRILSAWLPHWPITRLRQAPLPGKPLVTVESLRGQRVLASAMAEGLAPGQTLAEARALYPGLIALEADPAGDVAALVALAEWAMRYSPLTAIDTGQDHGLWLDVTGCAHLFSGEAELLMDIRARLARWGVPTRLSIAGSSGAAWALARSPTHADAIIPAGGERQALGELPVAVLRLDGKIVAGLRRLGVRAVADLARLPRAEVTARFGAGPVLRLDQAFGAVVEAIGWLHPPVPFVEFLSFAEPIGTAEDFSRALGVLSERLCARLLEAGQGGVRFTARFFRVDNRVREIAIATARPVREAAYVAKLLGMKLETIDPGFGVEAVQLVAEEVAALSATQAEAFAVADALDGLAGVVDRLANEIGAERIWRPAPFPSHVPERAVARLPTLAAAPSWERDPTQPRPVRLLRRPEPIEVTAPIPDDPPILFRWRRRVHRVRHATGPERIAAEWWRERQRSASDQNHRRQRVGREESDLLRDYYRLEDTDGARFWVFRAGLLRNGEHVPRWFLHGLFG